MKPIASIAFLCLLAASCKASKPGGRENEKAVLRRLDNGERVQSVLSFIAKLMYAGKQQLHGVRSAAPTAAPVTSEAEPTLSSDSPSLVPSDAPSFLPSDVPSTMPSDAPSIEPTGNIQGFIRCETIYACNSGGILGANNDGFWMSKLNRDGVKCETTCTLPVSIAPRKVLGWKCGAKCAE
jgi:hypothetical protein